MDLPAIVLPQIDLPFTIPTLIHPLVIHFAIALPVVILLIEFYNVFARKKSIGGFSFILILLTIVIYIAAYFTGIVDGKESFDLLAEAGKEELKEHKLLGTYLLLASGLLLFFKLLAMTGNTFFRFLFFLVLIGFIVLTFIQGKDGGELTYEHGANVERVKALDDALFDANEKLEEMNETQEPQKVEPKAEEKPEMKVETPAQPEAEPKVETVVEVKEEAPVSTPTPAQPVQEVVEKDAPVETISTPQTTETNAKVDSLLENVKQEMKQVSKKALETIGTTVEEVTEVVPTDIQRPTIETH